MLTVSRQSNIPPVEAGPYEAVCYSVVDIGTHSSQWGKKTIRNRQVVLTWEIPSQRIDVEDKQNPGQTKNLPRAASRSYTSSLDPKSNLRKHLVSWRTQDFTPEEEKGFDLRDLLGVPCLLNIIHKKKQDGTIKAVVDNVMHLRTKKKFTTENPLVYYDIEENGTEIPSNIPKWIVEQIMSSEEWVVLMDAGDAPQEGGDDNMEPQVLKDEDIPF
jgi:hypothetical protein